jgi:hypothetical protein
MMSMYLSVCMFSLCTDEAYPLCLGLTLGLAILEERHAMFGRMPELGSIDASSTDATSDESSDDA